MDIDKILIDTTTMTTSKGTTPVVSSLNQYCLGFILAGGRSTRMGKDKATVQLGGHTMLQIAQHLCHNTTIEKHFVVGGRFADLHEKVGGYGPGRAICDLITQMFNERDRRNGYALFIPVDMPFLTAVSVQNLIYLAQTTQRAIYYKDHYLPLVAPLTAENVQQLQILSKQNQSPSVRSVLCTMGAMSTSFMGKDNELANINSPEELKTVAELGLARASSQR